MNLMKCNKAKCKLLHRGQGNLQFQYRLGDEWIENRRRTWRYWTWRYWWVTDDT